MATLFATPDGNFLQYLFNINALHDPLHARRTEIRPPKGLRAQWQRDLDTVRLSFGHRRAFVRHHPVSERFMKDPLAARAASTSGPATDIVPVVPSDSVDFDELAMSLFIETAGALRVVTRRGETRTIQVVNQTLLPVAVRRVMATGTTATGIHALLVG